MKIDSIRFLSLTFKNTIWIMLWGFGPYMGVSLKFAGKSPIIVNLICRLSDNLSILGPLKKESIDKFCVYNYGPSAITFVLTPSHQELFDVEPANFTMLRGFGYQRPTVQEITVTRKAKSAPIPEQFYEHFQSIKSPFSTFLDVKVKQCDVPGNCNAEMVNGQEATKIFLCIVRDRGDKESLLTNESA